MHSKILSQNKSIIIKSINNSLIISIPYYFEQLTETDLDLHCGFCLKDVMLYPDSGISMDEENVLGDMIWSYNKAEL